MLYIGTREALPLVSSADLRIEAVAPAREGVMRWFSNPEVRFVGAHTGCSCGFPSVIAESPVEYYEGMSLDSDASHSRSPQRASSDRIASETATRTACIELYPVADGDEPTAPKGVLEWELGALDAERLFFDEGFRHIVRSGNPRPAGSP